MYFVLIFLSPLLSFNPPCREINACLLRAHTRFPMKKILIFFFWLLKNSSQRRSFVSCYRTNMAFIILDGALHSFLSFALLMILLFQFQRHARVFTHRFPSFILTDLWSKLSVSSLSLSWNNFSPLVTVRVNRGGNVTHFIIVNVSSFLLAPWVEVIAIIK